jgi:hypothetical protein
MGYLHPSESAEAGHSTIRERLGVRNDLQFGTQTREHRCRGSGKTSQRYSGGGRATRLRDRVVVALLTLVSVRAPWTRSAAVEIIGRVRGACSIAIGLCLITLLIFVGVAITEINYVNGHPYAYGPAKVIAWSGGAGAILSVAAGLVAIALLRRD